MKRKNKIIVLFCITVFTFLCYCSCTFGGSELCSEVVCCLNERDTKGLKELLCEKVRESDNIDEQIEAVFDLMGEETIISTDNDLTSDQKSIRNHKIVSHKQAWIIKPVKLSNGDEYTIRIYDYVVCDADSKKVGVYEITVIYDSIEYCIGSVSLV